MLLNAAEVVNRCVNIAGLGGFVEANMRQATCDKPKVLTISN